MNLRKFIFFIVIALCSCKDTPIETKELIDRVFESHGANNFKEIHLEFTFRNYDYTLHRDSNETIFIRTSNDDSLKVIKDVYPLNKGLQRYINEQAIQLSDSIVDVYERSLNSVMYFVQLPFKFKDKAVIAESIGTELIGLQPYQVLKITFEQQNGGYDYQDEYRYWIHPKNFTIDYLAYSFEENGGGMRFRKAFNRELIEGVIFQDYENYKPQQSAPLDSLAQLFSEDKLELVSLIENTKIKVH